ncbi:MAG: hypothetical protein M0Z75_07765 [Nitrospiraceae bacterium]|nr:hypothetical protein [Nitrospiraceae bacterium]MDA8091381.1 hypothetical protein [Nitrospiraceae bacterium]
MTLIEKIMKKEAHIGVSYNDPYIPVIRPSREYARCAGRKYEAVSGEFDLLLIATAHEETGNSILYFPGSRWWTHDTSRRATDTRYIALKGRGI